MKHKSLASVRLGNQSVRIMCDVLDEIGVDWQPLAGAAGIDPAVIEDPQGHVSGLNELHFQQFFAKATCERPGLWFSTGLRYRITFLGPLGLAVLAAKTAEAALRSLADLQDLSYSLGSYTLVYEAGELRGMVIDTTAIPEEYRGFCLERDLAASTMLLHDMMQRRFPLERIETSLQRPHNAADWERELDVEIVFGAPKTRWVFSPGAGAEVLPMASTMLEAAYLRLCGEIVGQAHAADDFTEKVSSLLLRDRAGVHSAVEVAARLAISERTLHRKLAQRNLSFGKLMDQVREKRARELLKSSAPPIDQISEFLGFADTPSFSRAFKRWTGVPPLQFRKRNVA
jgi:AraC-like DNA-binding protein